MSGQMLADCQSGLPLTADLRPGAVPRAASVWQSFIVRTDADGNVLWQRADQYRGDGDAALGQPGWEPISSASEFVAKCADGGLLFVNDEASGIGILKLNADGAPGASPSPPSPPLPPPETDGSEDSTPTVPRIPTPPPRGLARARSLASQLVAPSAGGSSSRSSCMRPKVACHPAARTRRQQRPPRQQALPAPSPDLSAVRGHQVDSRRGRIIPVSCAALRSAGYLADGSAARYPRDRRDLFACASVSFSFMCAVRVFPGFNISLTQTRHRVRRTICFHSHSSFTLLPSLVRYHVRPERSCRGVSCVRSSRPPLRGSVHAAGAAACGG